MQEKILKFKDASYLLNMFKEQYKDFKQEKVCGHLSIPTRCTTDSLDTDRAYLLIPLFFFWLSQCFGRRPSFPFSNTSVKQGKDGHKGTKVPHVAPYLKSTSDLGNGP